MVNISIDVTDLGGEAHPGDKVIFWRPRVGGSATHAGRVISTAPHTVVLEDGTATVPDVEPGEMRVLLQCRGFESQEPIPVVVPDGTGVVTLRALVESQFEYSPPVVSAVQQAADNAAASERNSKTSEIRSRQHADRAESIVDDAIANGAELVRDEVKQDADRAVAARQAAESAKGVTETARDEAVTAASSTAADIHDELDGLVTAADGHASRAESAADAAASGAVAQVRSELDGLVEDASQSKTAAATSETNAAQSEADAAASKSAAASSQSAAKTSETNAAGSASASAGSASTATTQADRAKTEADRAATIAGSTRWDGDKLTVNGQTSPSLTGPAGPSGAWTEITGKPATFPPSTHSHPISQVTGLQSELDSRPRKQVRWSYYGRTDSSKTNWVFTPIPLPTAPSLTESNQRIVPGVSGTWAIRVTCTDLTREVEIYTPKGSVTGTGSCFMIATLAAVDYITSYRYGAADGAGIMLDIIKLD